MHKIILKDANQFVLDVEAFGINFTLLLDSQICLMVTSVICPLIGILNGGMVGGTLLLSAYKVVFFFTSLPHLKRCFSDCRMLKIFVLMLGTLVLWICTKIIVTVLWRKIVSTNYFVRQIEILPVLNDEVRNDRVYVVVLFYTDQSQIVHWYMD